MADNDRITSDHSPTDSGSDAVRDSEQSLDGLDRSLAEALNDSGEDAPFAFSAAASGAAEPRLDDLEDLRQRVVAVLQREEYDGALLGRVVFQPGLPLVGYKARLIYEKLLNFGDVRYFAPNPDLLEELETLDSISFGVVTEKTLSVVQTALHIAGVQQTIVEPLLLNTEITSPLAELSRPAELSDHAAPSRSAPVAADSRPSPDTSIASPPTDEISEPAGVVALATQNSGVKPTETLRVDIARLDQLMGLAGQLVLHKAHITQTAERLKRIVAATKSTATVKDLATVLRKVDKGRASAAAMTGTNQATAAEIAAIRDAARCMLNDLDMVRHDFETMSQADRCIEDLADGVHLLDRVSNNIQQAAMDTHMTTIGPLFSRFKRVVRDLTRTSGKKVQLVVHGDQTELDKRMIDELSEPLIQLIRNAVDHGIEPPEVRQAAGKPAHGTIRLDAFRRGNSVTIQVADDGRGFDADQILAKALEKQLPNSSERMSRHDVLQLAWELGNAAGKGVSQAAGDGSGMAMIRSRIAKLSGTVDLDSEPGRGATLTIRLPLTLAILPSLMVKIDGDVFAVPLESVAEIVSVERRDVATVHGVPTARVRGDIISMISLRNIFAWRSGSRCGGNDDADTTLVILDEKGHRLGLTVDRVLGEEDVAIKPISDNYRNIPGIIGASICGDGRVSLILDPPAIFRMLSNVSSVHVQENSLWSLQSA